jgi:hypothetical protein
MKAMTGKIKTSRKGSKGVEKISRNAVTSKKCFKLPLASSKPDVEFGNPLP